MNNKNYYDILNLDKNCTEEDIKKSYKKLALLYHPDKNQGNEEATNKFKELSEAYSILSNKDKRLQYDTMGSVMENESFGNMEDPFSVFNSIFKQHLSSFMNMKYDNDVNISNIFGNIPGFSEDSIPFKNVHVSFQTFPVNDYNINNSNYNDKYDKYDEYDEYNDYNSPFDSIINNLQNRFKNKSKNIETKTKIKMINKKPDDIVYSLNVSLSDIYKKKIKKININRIRKKNGKYIEQIKTIDIPIYGKELLLEGYGNELKDYLEKGDVIINIFNKKHDNFKRVNEYDILTTKDIYVNQLYNEFIYEIILPHKEIIKICNNKLIDENGTFNQWQIVKNKGLPYINDIKEEVYGDLFIMYKIIFPNNFEDLKKIEINEEINKKINDKLNEDIRTNNIFKTESCNYDDIFRSNE